MNTECARNVDLGSISPTLYEQLLDAQIPKGQKKTVKLSSFFALLGSAPIKAACRMLVKLTPNYLCISTWFELKLIFVIAFWYGSDSKFLGSRSICNIGGWRGKQKQISNTIFINFFVLKIFEGLPNVSSFVEGNVLKWQQGSK